jgi:hypothetical protein
MKKQFPALLIIAIIAALYSCKNNTLHQSPTVLLLPMHHIKPADTPGTIIFTRITNTTNHSITLHPLLTPMRATDSATLIQGILSKVTPSDNIDKKRMKLIQIVGHYIKSTNKNSFFPNLRDNNNDTLINREYSLIGSGFSLPSWHCDNFCKEAIYLLECTKLFADSDFILQHCSIHTTMQVKMHNGDTVFVDMAVGTPVFMVANPSRKSGWASLSDILNDTTLVSGQSRYYFINDRGDSVDISPARSIDNYKLIFQLPWKLNNYAASGHNLDNFNGDFILAPGQSIEYRDTIGYIIDTSQNGIGAIIDADMQKAAYFGVAGKIYKDESYLDSASCYLYKPYSETLKVPVSEAASLFNNGKILLYSRAENWSPGYLPKQSVLYSFIPASEDTGYFGIQTSAPLLVTASTMYNEKTNDSFYVSFYADALFSAPPAITANQFNYANGLGRFTQILPHTSVNQQLLYNYNIFNFYKGGAMFLASGSGIVIQASSDATR